MRDRSNGSSTIMNKSVNTDLCDKSVVYRKFTEQATVFHDKTKPNDQTHFLSYDICSTLLFIFARILLHHIITIIIIFNVM